MGYYTSVLNNSPLTQSNRILSIITANFIGTNNFTLSDIYDACRPMFSRVYTTNVTVDATIRANLNALVNTGLLTRVSDGVYNVG